MIKPKMVFVEGGTFEMGSNDGYEDEKPVHPVTLSSFYIGQYPVTQKEWMDVMGFNPSQTKGDDLPVTDISWNEVQKFLTKLNRQTGKQYRLPTEAEWEFAARGGVESKGFKYAGSDTPDKVAWTNVNSKRLQPVGLKKPNELGLYDMSGNVWEWCEDRYGDYSSSAQTNPEGPDTGSDRVYRGGSWGSYPRYCGVANRNYDSPGVLFDGLGFRLAHDFETFNQSTKLNSNTEQLLRVEFNSKENILKLQYYNSTDDEINSIGKKGVINTISLDSFLQAGLNTDHQHVRVLNIEEQKQLASFILKNLLEY
jgi:formylglycine-generating enzyme required for sulfatase activity